MTVYPSQDTFVRGEASPRLHARASLDLYKAALSRCENFVTLPHGGLRKRGGTYFVAECIDSARRSRAIRYVFSDDQAYMLELGHQKLRIYAYGARVGSVEAVTPWTEDEIFAVKVTSSGDEIWFTHPSYEPRKLTRLAHTSWSFAIVPFTDGPFAAVNTDETLTIYASAAFGSAVTLVASAALFTSAMVGRLVRLDMESYENIQPWEPNTIIAPPTLGARRRFEGRVYESVTDYTVTLAVNAKTGATPPTHTKGTEWDGPFHYEVLPDIPTSGPNIINPDFNHGVQWQYLHSGFGIARITGFTDSTHVTAEVLSTFPDEVVGSGNPSSVWRLGAFDDAAFPGSVTIFEERLTYAERFSVYGSATGEFDNFEAGEKGDDAVVFRNAGGGAANDIVWLEDIDGFLAIGTIGGIRSLSGSGIDEALTPSSFKNRPSRCAPCANIQPVQVGKAYAYVQKGRKKLAELTLGQQLRFESDDLGQISEHIPKRGVIELAFQSSPDPFLWFPLDTGELGGFTYQPSQDVRGMHRHLLGGSFSGGAWGIVESACVTPGQTGEDDVWQIVKRTINGSTKRYIEIMTPAFEYGDITDAFQIDCGLSYSGAATATVSGATHLAGETVDVLADGKVYRGLTVSAGGAVTLPSGSAAAAVWHLGLPFESGADTLELDVGGRDGSIRGRKKRIVAVYLSVFETDLSGLEIASMIKRRWEPVKLTSIVPESAFASLYTGNIGPIVIDDSWEGQGQITIRHTNPTPCTIRAMTPAFDNEP